MIAFSKTDQMEHEGRFFTIGIFGFLLTVAIIPSKVLKVCRHMSAMDGSSVLWPTWLLWRNGDMQTNSISFFHSIHSNFMVIFVIRWMHAICKQNYHKLHSLWFLSGLARKNKLNSIWQFFWLFIPEWTRSLIIFSSLRLPFSKIIHSVNYYHHEVWIKVMRKIVT